MPKVFLGIEVDVKLEQLDKPYYSPQQPTLFPVPEPGQTQSLPRMPSNAESEDSGESAPSSEDERVPGKGNAGMAIQKQTG